MSNDSEGNEVRLAPSVAAVTLSHYQARELLAARQARARSVTVSPDLGLTSVAMTLVADSVVLPTGERLSWAEVERIQRAANVCFQIEDGATVEIRRFSEVTGWTRALMPTTGAPTTLVAGLPMHRIKDTDPWADSQTKIAALAPISGRVLDIATGLGYTAILAARTAEEVVTIELDPAALEIAAMNPWSRELFTRPNIRQLTGDAVEILPTMEDSSFTRLLHDPPMITIAGDLYGEAFYRELWRVLRRGGRLFHYIGDPQSASGRRTTAGVIRRLQSAGFTRVTRRPEAFGVLAQK
ncbi:MAG TPA: methyltransferase domain-containing protein [Ktedonobacterales bacterium]|nr:methyltransferase domain-containing protein [Ktedonobacterales bacterium]